MGMGQNETIRGPQVLVLGFIYQGFILGTYFFDPDSWVRSTPGSNRTPCRSFHERLEAVSPSRRSEEKVLTMLADVEHKLVEDGKAAEAAHEKYSKFCLHGLRDLEYDIKD